MDWVMIITVIGWLFTILGLTLGLFLYLASKIDGLGNILKSEIDSLRKGVQVEMRDFHGRLCLIEERFGSPKTAP